MERIFNHGSYSYKYKLELLQRKSLSLIVRPNAEIIVRAPIDASTEEIESFLVKKWRWLDRQLSELRVYRQPRRSKQYVSGESFQYLGRQYLLIVENSQHDLVKLDHSKLRLFTTQSPSNGNYNKLLLMQWYRRRQRIIFRHIYQRAIKKFKPTASPKLEIKDMKRRWGSFTASGVIYINPRLIEAPTEAIYYVLIHELCHIENARHDSAFYAALENILPNWRQVKMKLEEKHG
jgi:predicted metal-dependent hydrolase